MKWSRFVSLLTIFALLDGTAGLIDLGHVPKKPSSE